VGQRERAAVNFQHFWRDGSSGAEMKGTSSQRPRQLRATRSFPRLGGFRLTTECKVGRPPIVLLDGPGTLARPPGSRLMALAEGCRLGGWGLLPLAIHGISGSTTHRSALFQICTRSIIELNRQVHESEGHLRKCHRPRETTYPSTERPGWGMLSGLDAAAPWSP